ncbi:MAG: B12-binding domain-containing radical SAM protein [Phycisphaerae bacterium]
MIRKRKFRFVEPGSRRGRPFNAWITRWPLLGPMTLASILERRGYDVAVYNENISGPLTDNEQALEEICSADVVGISIMTSTAMRGYEIADRVRKECPETTIVFGGVHASFCPEEAAQRGDIVVRGEGENVIEPIARGEITSGIINAEPPADLNALPPINHFLMCDFDKLIARSRRRELYELPAMTSRGCPYGCTYCSVTRMFGRKVRRQSVDKAYSDLMHYASQGFRRFFFYDDNFTDDRAWTKELLERIAPLNFRFNAQARVDFHWADRSRRKRDEELLRILRRGGGDVLYVGYETIDDETARQWRKGYRGAHRLEQRLSEDTKILHDSGFWIHGMFVLGPEHTQRTAEKIVDFSLRNSLETMQISILTPLPGTPLMDQMRKHLVFNDYPHDWNFYDGTHCVYNHGRLGIEQVQRTILNAHRRFYRWGLSARRLRAVAAGSVPLRDKLALLWNHLVIARRTLADWREETKHFLELVRSKTETANSPA